MEQDGRREKTNSRTQGSVRGRGKRVGPLREVNTKERGRWVK